MRLSGLKFLLQPAVSFSISAAPLSASWLKRIRGGELIENDGHLDIEAQDPAIEDSFGGISLVIPLKFRSDELEIDIFQTEQSRLDKLTG